MLVWSSLSLFADEAGYVRMGNVDSGQEQATPCVQKEKNLAINQTEQKGTVATNVVAESNSNHSPPSRMPWLMRRCVNCNCFLNC